MKKDPRTYNILVVDDDEFTTALISHRIEKEPFRLRVEHDPFQAYLQIQQEAPDLLLLDILFPDLSGLELLNLIRHQLLLYHLPVILISSLEAGELHRSPQELGADDFLAKPIDLELMMKKIVFFLPPRRD